MGKDINLLKNSIDLADNSKNQGINKQNNKKGSTVKNEINVNNNYYIDALEKFSSEDSDSSKVRYMLDIIKKSHDEINKLLDIIKKSNEEKNQQIDYFYGPYINPDGYTEYKELIELNTKLNSFKAFIGCELEEKNNVNFYGFQYCIALNKTKDDFFECLNVIKTLFKD